MFGLNHLALVIVDALILDLGKREYFFAKHLFLHKAPLTSERWSLMHLQTGYLLQPELRSLSSTPWAQAPWFAQPS